MVFTGEWNGGERKFRLGQGQRLTLDRIVRLSPGSTSGGELVAGSLDELDRYDWAIPTPCAGGAACLRSAVQRQRARLPARYRISGALRLIGERGYRWTTNLPSPNVTASSSGSMCSSRWRQSGARRTGCRSPGSGAARAGGGFRPHHRLAWEGEIPPANAAPPSSPVAASRGGGDVRRRCAALPVAIRRRDRALGRFAPAPSERIDAAWLEAKVFALPPEVVGAIWDRRRQRRGRGDARPVDPGRQAQERGQGLRTFLPEREPPPRAAHRPQQPDRLRGQTRSTACSAARGRPTPKRSGSATRAPASTPRRRSAPASRRA